MSRGRSSQPAVSYAPPDRPDPLPGRVGRRHVFYLPGYDPEARTRYRALFVRELGLYARRFGGGRRVVGRSEISDDRCIQAWTVPAHAASGAVETRYEVLLWDDIVARDFARPSLVSLALLVKGTLYALLTGRITRFSRLNWKYAGVILYPFVLTLLLLLAGGGLAWLVDALIAPPAGWLALVPMAASVLVALGVGAACRPWLDRIYFWQFVNDWVFHFQHGHGQRRDYEARLDRFTDHMLDRLSEFSHRSEGAPDEVVILGHSTGAMSAVEVAARLLDRHPDLDVVKSRLALVTLGSALPLVALHPRAERLRADIARIVQARRIFWIDYVAAQDWLNFPRFNPIRDLDLGLPANAVIANPTIRSARFSDIIDEATYRKVRKRPFRMHFQYLMANERRGPYDFFAMMLGPLPQSARAHRFRSPRLHPAGRATPPDAEAHEGTR